MTGPRVFVCAMLLISAVGFGSIAAAGIRFVTESHEADGDDFVVIVASGLVALADLAAAGVLAQ